jgi:phosphate transport system permease protein
MKFRFFDISRGLRSSLHTSWMATSLVLVMLIPLLLFAGLAIKSSPLLRDHTLMNLLFSSNWKPFSGQFGFYPFIISSVWVTLLSLLFSIPICLLTSIHLTQYAKKWVLKIVQPVIDILAGIPSVVYGVWGVLVIVPFIANDLAPMAGKTVSGYSILAGAIVLSIMIIPFILNILIELFNNIPVELSEASLSLGATRWQTIKYVVLKKGLPGIISSFGLGMSRAFGETIAVLMVVGNVAVTPKGLFQPGYPLPALIANNYGEMMSIPQYDAALMLSAFILLIVVLFFNAASRLLIIQSIKRG